MIATNTGGHEELGQQHLGHALTALRAQLRIAAATDGESRKKAEKQRDAAIAQGKELLGRAAHVPPLEHVRRAFELSEFEYQTLVLLCAWELDRHRIRGLLQDATGSPEAVPTMALAMALLQDPHWSACTPNAPLRRFRLLEFDHRGALLTRPIEIEESILHFLKSAPVADSKVTLLAAPVLSAAAPTPRQLDVVGKVSASPTVRHEGAVVQLHGRRADCLAVAAEFARLTGSVLLSLPARSLPSSMNERQDLLQRIERDHRLGVARFLITVDRGDAREAGAALRWICERATCSPLLIATDSALDLEGTRRIAVPAMTVAEQNDIWSAALEEHAPGLDIAIGDLVAQFRLDPPTIIEVVEEATESPAASAEDLNRRLWDGCREAAVPVMDGLAQTVTSTAHWDDLILPRPQIELLRTIAIQTRQRKVVNLEWGMPATGATNPSVIAAFAGPSGTGKTLAASVLANELGLPLFRVDLSTVVDKYVGETEKHLARLFDAADLGGAVLLFDEADAIFGKRSQASSAHDRYANLEVSFLLQRVEAYRGLAILTTNHLDHLDSAFMRRIHFVAHFPTPGRRQRLELWKRAFPEPVPMETIDLDLLAEVELTGGSIRNIALIAASAGAEAGKPISIANIVHGMEIELAKLGRRLSPGLSGLA